MPTKKTQAEAVKALLEDPKTTEAKKQPTRLPAKRLVLFVLLVLASLVVGTLIVFAMGIYDFQWRGSVTRAAIGVVPYPAAIVNVSIVPYSTFLDDVDTLNFFYAAQQTLNPGVQAPSEQELRQIVLTRMIKDILMRKKAQAYGVSISQADVDKEFQSIVSQAGSVEEVRQTLTTLYNWDEKTFKDKVLLPFLLSRALEEKLAYDPQLNKDAKQKAEEVLAKLQAGGVTFEDLARQYSEDVTASSDGDLGFVQKGDLVPEFEDAMLKLKEGETSGIVQTRYGFHIIKLVKIVPATDTKPEQYSVKHILLKAKSLDTWLQEELARTRVLVAVQGYYWAASCDQVLLKGEQCPSASG